MGKPSEEEYMILEDRLDDLFYEIEEREWIVPVWMLRELRLVYAQYKRIQKGEEG